MCWLEIVISKLRVSRMVMREWEQAERNIPVHGGVSGDHHHLF